MFGGTATNPASGFSFGGTAAAAPATSSGFSFGGTAAAAPATSSGFSFGGTNSTTTPTTGGSAGTFGSTANTAATSSGFSFGSSAPSTATTVFNTTPSSAPSTSGFGGFGTSSASKPPLFGQGAGGATSSGVGFESNTTTTTTAPSFGSFGGGSTTTSSTGFGGFGTNTAKPAGTGGFNFGSGTTATTTTNNTGFGFGNQSTTGFGGFTSTPGTTNTGFGGLNTQPSTNAPATNTPAPIVVGTDASVAQLNTIKFAYQDPMQSRFKFLMYNTVDPSQRHLYIRPPYISERLWDQAEQDNPDPFHYVPVPITGFPDLLKRIQVQQQYAAKYTTYATDLQQQLKEMEKASRATDEKLETCRHEHVQLMHTLVKVMKDIEYLQHLGKPLKSEEIQFATTLKKLQTLLNAPGQYKARLQEAVTNERLQTTTALSTSSHPSFTHLSPADKERLYQFLDQQRQGLEHLTNILNEDLADIKLMKETWRR